MTLDILPCERHLGRNESWRRIYLDSSLLYLLVTANCLHLWKVGLGFIFNFLSKLLN